MIKSFFINAVSLLLLAAASVAYFILFAGYVPGKHKLLINLMLVPLLFGIAGFFLLKGGLLIKLILLAVLPLVHVIYFGSDSGKPALDNIFAVGEYIFIFIGVNLGKICGLLLRPDTW